MSETFFLASPHQVSLDMGGETAILNLETGLYHGLDHVGTRVWAMLVDGCTLADLIEVIMDEYDVDRPRCAADLGDLLVALEHRGLLNVRAAPDQ